MVAEARRIGKPVTTRSTGGRGISGTLFYLILIIIAVIDLFPPILIGLISFKPQIEIFKRPPSGFPETFIWDNSADALALLPAGQQPVSDTPAGLVNSLITAGLGTVLLIVV